MRNIGSDHPANPVNPCSNIDAINPNQILTQTPLYLSPPALIVVGDAKVVRLITTISVGDARVGLRRRAYNASCADSV